VIRAFGRFARRVYDAGIDQDDFNPTNVFLRDSGGGAPEFLLVDFERVTLRPSVPTARRLWTIAKMGRVGAWGGWTDVVRFLKAVTPPATVRELRQPLRQAWLRVLARDLHRWRRSPLPGCPISGGGFTGVFRDPCPGCKHTPDEAAMLSKCLPALLSACRDRIKVLTSSCASASLSISHPFLPGQIIGPLWSGGPHYRVMLMGGGKEKIKPLGRLPWLHEAWLTLHLLCQTRLSAETPAAYLRGTLEGFGPVEMILVRSHPNLRRAIEWVQFGHAPPEQGVSFAKETAWPSRKFKLTRIGTLLRRIHDNGFLGVGMSALASSGPDDDHLLIAGEIPCLPHMGAAPGRWLRRCAISPPPRSTDGGPSLFTEEEYDCLIRAYLGKEARVASLLALYRTPMALSECPSWFRFVLASLGWREAEP
jgi:hypothetical protein